MGIGEQIELETYGSIEPEVEFQARMRKTISQPKAGKLYGMRCYLIGAMDRVKDGGVEWRDAMIPFLRHKGVVALNPCDKPIQIGAEGAENRARRHELKQLGRYDEVSTEMKEIRVVDLRMVDMSDFLICNIDLDVHACGTYEELSWANRLKRPVLIHCEQGKASMPDWAFAMLPHQLFFDTWLDVRNYLCKVNMGQADHLKRWMFFDYDRLTPEGQERYCNK